MNRVAEQVTTETDAKIAAVNARIDRVVELVYRNNEYDRATDHELHTLIIARMRSTDDSPYWEFCEEKGLSMLQLRAMLADYERRVKQG